MDPTYQEVVARGAKGVGSGVNWRVKLLAVSKRFYTYTFEAEVAPPPGTPRCNRCRLIILFRGKPEENARPPRFKAGDVLTIRGTVIAPAPKIKVLAGALR